MGARERAAAVGGDLTPVDLRAFGVAVGHATDDAGATGLTVVRGIDGPLPAAVVFDLAPLGTP